jgi:FkbM family methyltransferase
MLNTTLYRLGRRVYTATRLELGKNDININGETWLQQRVLSNFKDKALTIFDIGANVGDWTMSLLKQCPSNVQINVHAFEPVSQTYNKLAESLADISQPNQQVTLNQVALSNESGTTEIHISSNLAGSNSLYSTSESKVKEVIKLTTIDQYCELNNISSVELIKIDVEGHDMFAIQGALGMLQAEKISVLQFEYNHRWVFSRRYLKDVFDFRDNNSLQYVVGKLTGNGVYVYSDWHFEMEKFFEGNYLLISRRFVETLQATKVSYDDTNSLIGTGKYNV